jgi:sigma-B regulation protein RsbU (phosphoserine phosphatase)
MPGNPETPASEASPEPDMNAVNESSPFASGDFAGAFALLAEMTQDFADSLDIETTLERALEKSVAHLDAVVGSWWLVEEERRELVCRASIGPNPITGMHLPLTQGIIGRCVRENRCATVLDAQGDPEFARKVDEKSGFVTHSLLCAPLSFSDRPLGAIQVVNKRSESACFTEPDAHLLQVLAASAALAIANARMAAAAVEHERVHRELEIAAEIQRNLLPAPRPRPFPIHGVNVAARTVSGDFFDILPLESGRIAFCLGDVSGKGMNAALLMAKTASLYRCLAKSVAWPGTLLSTLNDEIFETVTRGMFVTMVAGVYDPATGLIRLANAGHEPPLRHAHSGEFESIPADAPPLGILPGGEFPEAEVQLDGDTLYIFSDGVTEAYSKTGEQLGSEGLRRLITGSAHMPPAGRVDAIIARVQSLELRDDLTLLAVCGDCVDVR